MRGHRIILSIDLCEMYEVEHRALNQAVKRNIKRFPKDFIFLLNNQELSILKSQNVISSLWGGRRHSPYAFTEQGVAMLSSVLKSEKAIQVNIEIMRTFVNLREMISTHKELSKKLNTLEKKYDSQFKVVFDAIKQLMTPPIKPKKKIGYT